jgi:hypothetical protein
VRSGIISGENLDIPSYFKLLCTVDGNLVFGINFFDCHVGGWLEGKREAEIEENLRLSQKYQGQAVTRGHLRKLRKQLELYCR